MLIITILSCEFLSMSSHCYFHHQSMFSSNLYYSHPLYCPLEALLTSLHIFSASRYYLHHQHFLHHLSQCTNMKHVPDGKALGERDALGRTALMYAIQCMHSTATGTASSSTSSLGTEHRFEILKWLVEHDHDLNATAIGIPYSFPHHFKRIHSFDLLFSGLSTSNPH